ncbi:hypothetical protein ACEYW6_13780 [Nostoc sp. UIC 10607]|uniref:hypothetical protein n=1 Tax=Nostoc sp. UIC 10607 TaxID=3045935 RepID=UPI00399F94C6
MMIDLTTSPESLPLDFASIQNASILQTEYPKDCGFFGATWRSLKICQLEASYG